jgi:hypothetical protein
LVLSGSQQVKVWELTTDGNLVLCSVGREVVVWELRGLASGTPKLRPNAELLKGIGRPMLHAAGRESARDEKTFYEVVLLERKIEATTKTIML